MPRIVNSLEAIMTKSRKLDPDDFSDEDTPKVPEGLDLRALGPSDSSAAGKEDIRDANDIAPDRIVGARGGRCERS